MEAWIIGICTSIAIGLFIYTMNSHSKRFDTQDTKLSAQDKLIEAQQKLIETKIDSAEKSIAEVYEKSILKCEKESKENESRMLEKFNSMNKAVEKRFEDIVSENLDHSQRLTKIEKQNAINTTDIEWLKKDQ